MSDIEIELWECMLPFAIIAAGPVIVIEMLEDLYSSLHVQDVLPSLASIYPQGCCCNPIISSWASFDSCTEELQRQEVVPETEIMMWSISPEAMSVYMIMTLYAYSLTKLHPSLSVELQSLAALPFS